MMKDKIREINVAIGKELTNIAVAHRRIATLLSELNKCADSLSDALLDLKLQQKKALRLQLEEKLTALDSAVMQLDNTKGDMDSANDDLKETYDTVEDAVLAVRKVLK